MNTLFEPIPEETVQGVFGSPVQNARYLRVGDQLNALLGRNALEGTDFAPHKPRRFIALLVLVTLFEYVEHLTDAQAAEAAGRRADWKYALHLPLSYPGFDPVWLCLLRQHALTSAGGTAAIQVIAERLAPAGLFDTAPCAEEIVASICQRNRIDQLVRSLFLAVEALAAQQLTWPNRTQLASLYESYAGTLRDAREIRSPQAAVRLGQAVGADIESLLGALQAVGRPELGELSEVKVLKAIWEKQYERLEEGGSGSRSFAWRPVDCQSCSMGIGAVLS